jgi:hypothetical protein
MNEPNKERKMGYFAAANSYSGFISYFDKVFDTREFTRLYILKGGPGTGKSSLMKRLSARFSEAGCDTEEIYCSSDPHSLDGVIIRKNDKQVAIIDGTAPHQRDTMLPGAADELVNLGQGWEAGWLIANRDKITRLNSDKGKAYKTAYFYLRIAGVSNEEIKQINSSTFSKTKANSWAEALLSSKSMDRRGLQKTKLISSFGRYGEYSLDSLPKGSKSEIKLCGKAEFCQLLLRYCYEYFTERSLELIHYPNALDPTLTDAIYLPSNDTLLCYSDQGNVSSEEFFNPSELDAERMKKARYIRSDALEEAKRWFQIASDIHFRIEKIYGQSMNFEVIDKIAEEKAQEIANILEINL